MVLSCSRGLVYARVELLPEMCHLKLPALGIQGDISWEKRDPWALQQPILPASAVVCDKEENFTQLCVAQLAADEFAAAC